MTFDLRSVLWRTRGRHWDYTFVLHPSTPLCDSWFDVHKRAFAGMTPSEVPVTRGGMLLCGTIRRPYLATSFLDEQRRDAWGRPVAHYIMCFLSSDVSGTLELSVPYNWGQQVVSSLDGIWGKMFDLSSSEMQTTNDGSIEACFAHARDDVNGILLRGTSISVPLDTDIEVTAPHENIVNGTSLDACSPICGASLDVSKHVESAIIEGEAFALGFKGYLGTCRLLLSLTQDEELLQCLADSFGGASSDQFINNRLKDIKKRVAQTKLSSKPRRGFDVLVDVLKTMPFEYSIRKDNYMQIVSQFLGASVDDLVVRNLVSRLKALASQ